MTYIILRNTFGRGLETISNIGLEMIDEYELDDYICDVAEIILVEDDQYATLSDYDEDGNTPMGETLVICEILRELKGKNVDTYIQDVLKQKEEKENTEDYELYLKLKEKFEK